MQTVNVTFVENFPNPFPSISSVRKVDNSQEEEKTPEKEKKGGFSSFKKSPKLDVTKIDKSLFRFEKSDYKIYSLKKPESSENQIQQVQSDDLEEKTFSAAAAADKNAPDKTLKLPRHVSRLRDMYLQENAEASHEDLLNLQLIDTILLGERNKVVDENLMLAEEMQKMKTDKEALVFFAKNGSQTKVKFVYGIRKDVLNNPYELTIVSGKKAFEFSEYFTVSSTGIVRIGCKEETEFISLSDWVSESLNFRLVKKIPFFKNFLNFKLFNVWKSKSRFFYFQKTRNFVSFDLNIVRPHFCSHIFNVKQLMKGLTSISSIKLTDSGITNVEEILAVVENGLTGINKIVEQKFEKLVDCAVELVQSVKNEAKIPESFLKPCKGIVQEKEKKKLLKKRAKIIESDNENLSECVKCFDMILKDSMTQLALNIAREVHAQLMISAKILHRNTPSENQINSFIFFTEAIFNKISTNLSNVDNLNNLKKFDEIVKNNKNYNENCKNLFESISTHKEFLFLKQQIFDRANGSVGN